MPSATGPDPARLSEFPLSLFYVREGEKWFVKTVSDDYKGFHTHYSKPSAYCPGARCNCRLKAKRRQWLGYGSVVRWDDRSQLWVPCVLQITEALEHDLDGVWRRGQLWELARRSGDATKKNYPVTGRYVSDVPPEQLPPSFGYLDTVLRAYHVEQIEEYFDNPVPKPIKVQVHAAPPPGAGPVKQAERPVTPELLAKLRERARGVGSMPEENGHS